MTPILSFSDALSQFQNLDLVAVAIAIAAIGIMGFVVYFSDRTSATNRAFLLFAIFTIAYGITNYFSYKFATPHQTLWILRLTIFSATLHAFSFFNLFYVFPRTKVAHPKWFFYGVIPWTTLVAGLTLTPLTFPALKLAGGAGNVSSPAIGPAMPLFGLTTGAFVLLGIYWLIQKSTGKTTVERNQSRTVLIGAVFTFALILTFNLILPALFGIVEFIPLAPVFFLPFILATSHAIRRYHFLDVKVIATELVAFALAVITLVEIVFADDLGTLVLRVGTFSLVLAFSILLIRSVIKEVEQREHLQEMTEELTDANTKLKQLDRVRSEFLSFASHQVKAPMSVVKGYAQLISDGTFGAVPEKVVETSNKIKESADRLIALVNNLLDLRRLEEGRMEFAFEKIDVSQLITEVVNDIMPLAQKKGLTLTVEVPSAEQHANADVQKFRQVVQNLVDNAIKYTENGWIKVALKRQATTLIITVSDSGRGMPKDLIPQLFEQFHREKDAAKRIEGTGLGLYIAKQIVLGHKGTIVAGSEGPGKGSVFTVTLPAA